MMNFMKKTNKQAFTLIELIVVVLIIGVISGITVPSLVRTREKNLDRQAQVILGNISAGERSYGMMRGWYWPSSSTSSVAAINTNLHLELVNDGVWAYSLTGGANTFTATLSRNRGGYSRTWTITESDANATCSGNCP